MEEQYKNFISEILNDEALSKEFLVFCERLLDKAGFADFPIPLKSKMVLDLSLRLKNFLILKFLDKLPPEAYKELDDFIVGAQNYQENTENFNEFVKNFVNKYIPNMEEFIETSLIEFSNIFLGQT